jgi:hypothetical protein
MLVRGCERLAISQSARLGHHPLSLNQESRSIMRLEDIRTKEVKGRLICVLFNLNQPSSPYIYKEGWSYPGREPLQIMSKYDSNLIWTQLSRFLWGKSSWEPIFSSRLQVKHFIYLFQSSQREKNNGKVHSLI